MVLQPSSTSLQDSIWHTHSHKTVQTSYLQAENDGYIFTGECCLIRR